MTRRSRHTHRTALGVLLLLATLLLPQAACAQLYSWKDAAGNVTIKNYPPPWYKQDEASRGPRVQVLREGKVVDDTGWSMERRLEGRAQVARQEGAASTPAQAPVPAAPQAADGQQPTFTPEALRALQAIQAIQAIQKQNKQN